MSRNMTRTMSNNDTRLIRAASAGDLDKIRQLALSPYKLFSRAGADYANSIYIAAELGHVDIVRHFLSKLSKINKPYLDTLYKTHDCPIKRNCLHIACENGHAEVVQVLLTDGQMNISAQLEDGTTPLMIACKKGNSRVLRCLLDHQTGRLSAPLITHQDNTGNSAEHYAREHEDIRNILNAYRQRDEIALPISPANIDFYITMANYGALADEIPCNDFKKTDAMHQYIHQHHGDTHAECFLLTMVDRFATWNNGRHSEINKLYPGYCLLPLALKQRLLKKLSLQHPRHCQLTVLAFALSEAQRLSQLSTLFVSICTTRLSLEKYRAIERACDHILQHNLIGSADMLSIVPAGCHLTSKQSSLSLYDALQMQRGLFKSQCTKRLRAVIRRFESGATTPSKSI